MSDDRTATEELTSAERLTGSKAGRLTPEAEAEIERARITNVITAAIAGLSWGENMSTAMRRAYAEYCRRYDVDPVTEMDNLAGQPYVNAEWYKRKLGELRIAGVVRDVTLTHIQADPRLVTLMTDERLTDAQRSAAREKWFDSLMQRIEQNVPEDAAAACVCKVTLAMGGTPVTGCKWAGNGTSTKQPRHNGTAQPNPIAEANATLFVESTAIRRAAMMLFSHLTGQRLSDKAGEYVGLARSLALDVSRTLAELPDPTEMVEEGKRLAPAWITHGKPKPWTGAPVTTVRGGYDTTEEIHAETARIKTAIDAGEEHWEQREARTEAERDADMRKRAALLGMAARARDPYAVPLTTDAEMTGAAADDDPVE